MASTAEKERTMRKFLSPEILAAALAAALASTAQAQVHPEKPTYKFEKCYGIAKAGQNDCFTATNSCGGTSKKDNDPNAWKYVPAGSCEKVGGSLKAGSKPAG